MNDLFVMHNRLVGNLTLTKALSSLKHRAVMKCTRTFLLLTIFLLAILPSHSVHAQYYYYNNQYYDNDLVFEIGAGIGGMNCITDLGGNPKGGFYIKDINWKNTNLNANLSVGAMYQGMIGARLQVTYGSVHAFDSILKGTSGAALARYQGRNASFKSSIREIALVAEFHPLMLINYEEGAPALSPYVLAGIGWFSFNPQSKINNQWIDLRPLHTEGQDFPEYRDRKTYHLSQANFPIGVRAKI